ncbi:MAG TPA: (d)CMP kinase [Bacteroidales bacterium]|nr:(d)CMP kinase [Bacteroidales bacterium]
MNNTPNYVIAIDGYSSCGKSTFAKAIAALLQYIYIDTGAMYRAVTLYALNNKLITNGVANKEAVIEHLPKINVRFERETDGQVKTILNGEDVSETIRNLEVSKNVSAISAIKEVRQKMVELQRSMGKQKRVVLDGRDIGTVVFPDAEIKIFMTADPKVRAQRRYDELIAKNMPASFDEVYQNIIDRDHLDTTRAESPLTKADDAIVLDNTLLTPQEQVDWFLELVKSKG